MDDTRRTAADGDDAFGGAVGDDLPGGVNYQGRHARAGEGDGVGEPSVVPGVPGGWPGDDEAEGHLPPTSPVTGAASQNAARAAYADAPKGSAGQAGPASASPTAEAPAEGESGLAAERLADLQRLNAEYSNYKRRVDRERALDKDRTVAGVMESLLPVLDEIHLARQHGELDEGTPFAKIAAKLETILAKYGVEAFGEVHDTFDPTVHEAIMHSHAELPPGITDTTVVQVMQPGYRLGERVVRPALVAVADPQ